MKVTFCQSYRHNVTFIRIVGVAPPGGFDRFGDGKVNPHRRVPRHGT